MTAGVLCLGEMMLELSRSPDGRVRLGFGGDTFNTACYLARLGQPVGYLTAFGDDPWSAEARALLQAEGVDETASPSVPGRTLGLYAITTGATGERSFTYWREASPARDLFGTLYHAQIGAALREARLVYLSGVTLWLYDDAGRQRLFGLLAAARQGGVRVAFDGNFRPRLWHDRDAARSAYDAMLRLTDICLATFDDEAMLWGDTDPAATVARLTAHGIRDIVVKLGAAGCLVGPATHVPTTPNPAPVDTTAAGDSFNAAWIAARLRGLGAVDAAIQGNRLAAEVIAHSGALIPAGHMPAL
jgi:2-dehydro-3-deoxygluconokinase